jgi:hypothetical protein
MRRAGAWLLVVLLVAGCGHGAKHADPLEVYESPRALVEAVERGEAEADAFVLAMKKGPLHFEDISPEAVANYLEAVAYEGMLNRVPGRYTGNDEMVTSYETVFEDARNVFNNWEAYKAFLQRVYHAGTSG